MLPVNVSVTTIGVGLGEVGVSSSHPATAPPTSATSSSLVVHTLNILPSSHPGTFAPSHPGTFLLVHDLFEAPARAPQPHTAAGGPDEVQHVLHFVALQRRVPLDLRQRPARVRVQQMAV